METDRRGFVGTLGGWALGALAATNHYFFFVVVFTGWSTSSSKLAPLSDRYHRLNLPAHHEFLLGGKKLVAANFT